MMGGDECMFKSYLLDEQAGLDDSISKVIFMIVAIACGLGMFFYIFNLLKSRSEKASCANHDGPFCVD